jgi:hypothetical protein
VAGNGLAHKEPASKIVFRLMACSLFRLSTNQVSDHKGARMVRGDLPASAHLIAEFEYGSLGPSPVRREEHLQSPARIIMPVANTICAPIRHFTPVSLAIDCA